MPKPLKSLPKELVEKAKPNDFVVKDSGKRLSYDSGMVRDTTEGKPRFEFLIPDGIPYDAQFLTRIAAHMAKGAAKYGDRNWEKANSSEELARARGSALRHMLQWQADETDEDHAAAVFFNMMFAETVKWKLENGR